MRRSAGATLLAIMSLLVLGSAGCEPADAPDGGPDRSAASTGEAGPDASPPAARSEAELGPVRLVVELDPPEPRLSDLPHLTITIDAADGVEVHKPPFGEAVGSFSVLEFNEPLPELAGGRQIIRQIYQLEPMTTGEVTIAPIPVTFEDKRPDGDGQEHTIESEPITVTVTSMVADEAPGLDAIAPLEGPVELPAEPGAVWPILLAVVLGGAVLGWWLWRRKRGGRTEQGPRLSPSERAYLELQRLLEDDPIGRGELQTFYVELTLIVRRFIERTRGIRAPEQTTAEFLREMQISPAFAPEERTRLKAFLESADLVKFAAARPGPDEIEASFERAKEFVGHGTNGSTRTSPPQAVQIQGSGR